MEWVVAVTLPKTGVRHDPIPDVRLRRGFAPAAAGRRLSGADLHGADAARIRARLDPLAALCLGTPALGDGRREPDSIDTVYTA